MKRFISEYAKFKKQNIAKNQLMQEQIKDEQIKKIVREVKNAIQSQNY